MKQETLDTTVGGMSPTNTNGSPLKDVKEAPSAPKTPVKECPVITPFVKETPSGNSELAHEDFREVLKEIVYWQQPFISGKIFLAIAFVYYSTLEGGYDPVNLLVYALALRLISVAAPRRLAMRLSGAESSFLKTFAKMLNTSADYIQETFQFPSADQVSFVVKSVSATVEKSAVAAVQALNNAETDFAHLKIVLAHLVVLMALTSIFSLWTVIFVGTLIAMTIPALYSRHHEKIDPLIEKAKTKSAPYVEKAKEKGKVVYEKATTKAQEITKSMIAKYKERMAKKETKSE